MAYDAFLIKNKYSVTHHSRFWKCRKVKLELLGEGEEKAIVLLYRVHFYKGKNSYSFTDSSGVLFKHINSGISC